MKLSYNCVRKAGVRADEAHPKTGCTLTSHRETWWHGIGSRSVLVLIARGAGVGVKRGATELDVVFGNLLSSWHHK